MNGINHNLAASGVANTLNSHYGRLASSMRHLSTGLRIHSAADDAAGLAIRELMRSDISVLSQGMRNANDAISMLQVADGALAIIDEKLIRMKELAEQAATGTYDSTQRLMIDSEFRAMAAEIDRIALATDFNGIHLLDGSLSGEHDGRQLDSAGAMKIHFGTGNDSAEDYYYVKIGECTTKALGLHDPEKIFTIDKNAQIPDWLKDANTTINIQTHTAVLSIASRRAGAGSPAGIPGLKGQDYYELPVGLENVRITSSNASTYAHKPHVNLFTRSGKQLTGHTIEPPNDWWNDLPATDVINAMVRNKLMDAGATWSADFAQAGVPKNEAGMSILIDPAHPQNERQGDEVITIDKITADLVFVIGGHENTSCNNYNLKVEARIPDGIWAGLTFTEVDGDTTSPARIDTQEKAQQALQRIENAIVSKDTIRAHLGALKNRLENTVTNLSVQGKNMQAAESRISDTDVAQEMMQFVRNQIMSQAAVAMLGQANSYPSMLMKLVND